MELTGVLFVLTGATFIWESLGRHQPPSCNPSLCTPPTCRYPYTPTGQCCPVCPRGKCFYGSAGVCGGRKGLKCPIGSTCTFAPRGVSDVLGKCCRKRPTAQTARKPTTRGQQEPPDIETPAPKRGSAPRRGPGFSRGPASRRGSGTMAVRGFKGGQTTVGRPGPNRPGTIIGLGKKGGQGTMGRSEARGGSGTTGRQRMAPRKNCNKVTCPQMDCPNQFTPPGSCCPICRADQRSPTQVCNKSQCPRLSCVEQFTPQGACCPRCEDLPDGPSNKASGNTAGGTGNRAGGSGNRAGGTGNRAGGTGNRAGGSGNRAGGSGNRAGVSGNRAGIPGSRAGGNGVGLAGNREGGAGNGAGGAGYRSGSGVGGTGRPGSRAGGHENTASWSRNKAGGAIDRADGPEYRTVGYRSRNSGSRQNSGYGTGYNSNTYRNRTVIEQRERDPCARKVCPMLRCRSQYTPEGRCCPICARGGYSRNNRPMTNSDPCRFYTCQDLYCQNQYTPDGQCCPVCVKGCNVGRMRYDEGDSVPGYDVCTECSCSQGDVTCQYKQCEYLMCDDSYIPPGECCPMCPEPNGGGF